MENSDLPQEIMLEIFVRLPAKSVGRCRCLSKTWNTCLSTKQFVNSHLTRTKTDQLEEMLIIVVRSGSLHIVNIPLENEGEVISKEIQLASKWISLFGSCNGLILLMESDLSMFVLNPITNQQVQLPHSGFASTLYNYGFGYDSSCDDYKVVTFSFIPRPKKGHKSALFLELFSLRKRVWKRVVGLPSKPSHPVMIMPFVNGAVHWLTLGDSTADDPIYRIDSFDLANETFHRIPFPKGLKAKSVCDGLAVFKGCLSIVNFESSKDSVDVWVLKEYGVVDSWVKVHFDVSVMGKAVRHVSDVGDNEDQRVYVTSTTDIGDCLICCEFRRTPYHYKLLWSVFVESLVSPEQDSVSG